MKTKNQTTLASKYWLLILSLICIILMGLSLVTESEWAASDSGKLHDCSDAERNQ